MLENEKSKIQAEEIPRMEKVMKSFALYKRIEIGIIITGLFLFFYFTEYTVTKGLGLGLFIQATLMLVFDFFAESRGRVYLDWLRSLL